MNGSPYCSPCLQSYLPVKILSLINIAFKVRLQVRMAFSTMDPNVIHESQKVISKRS